MSDLLERICQDHINMAQVLKLIASEIDALEAEEPRDLQILDEAMRYMINYADQVHHPVEDIMFRRLLEIAPECGETIEYIFNEHKVLGTKGQEFQTLVQDVEYGDFVNREQLVAAGREYVQSQYSHMTREEKNLLNTAKLLASRGWLDVEEHKMIDPVFGEKVEQEYKYLHDYIVRQYGNNWRAPAHRVI